VLQLTGAADLGVGGTNHLAASEDSVLALPHLRTSKAQQTISFDAHAHVCIEFMPQDSRHVRAPAAWPKQATTSQPGTGGAAAAAYGLPAVRLVCEGTVSNMKAAL
jgi:hypothetical protein